MWLHLSKSVIWGHIWNLTQDRNRTDRTDRQDEQTRHIGWTNRVERISGRNFSQLYLYFKYFESGDFIWVQIAFSTLSQHGKISRAEPYRTNLSASCEVCFYTLFFLTIFSYPEAEKCENKICTDDIFSISPSISTICHLYHIWYHICDERINRVPEIWTTAATENLGSPPTTLVTSQGLP